jgi:molybdate transport system substrate-binding protein
MRAFVCAAVLLIGAFAGTTGATAKNMKVLAAAATEVGVRPLMSAYEAASGNAVAVIYATGPEIQTRVMSGESADIVIGPQAVIEALAKGGKTRGVQAKIGSTGIWMGVRRGTPQPDIGTVEALKAALASADTVIFSRAATGIYMEGLIHRLGLDDGLGSRVERPVNGQALVARLASGHGLELGFTASTELRAAEAMGVVMVAPLPLEVQNYTTAYASAEAEVADQKDVQDLLAYITSPSGRALLKSKGLD